MGTIETIFVSGLISIICALLGLRAGLSVERFKHKAKREDEERGDEQEISKEEILDRREMSTELWQRVKELERVIERYIKEKLETSEVIQALRDTIHELKTKLHSANLLIAEQDEEVVKAKAQRERIRLEFEEYKKNSLNNLLNRE